MVNERLNKIILWAAWLLFAWAGTVYLLHPIHDGDTWWHLAHGREMLESHHLLRTDVFSHTLTNTPWINFEWLSEISAYKIVELTGLQGLIIVKALLGLIAVLLLIALIAIGGTRGTVLFALSWLGYQVLQVRLCTRVELVSFIFLPSLMLLILNFF